MFECPQTPDELGPAAFVEPGFEHGFTLDRLRAGSVAVSSDSAPRVTSAALIQRLRRDGIDQP